MLPRLLSGCHNNNKKMDEMSRDNPQSIMTRVNTNLIKVNRETRFFLVLVSLFLLYITPVFSLAQDVRSGLNSAAEGVFGAMKKQGSFSVAIGQGLQVILAFVGVLFFVLLVYGGVQWLFAEGKPEQIEKAKTLMVNSTIGLIIVLTAFSISIIITNVFVEVMHSNLS